MPLGLRGRLILVLVAVSALSLAVAATTLLSPLDRQLREDATRSFAVSLHNESGALSSLSASAFVTGDRRLLRAARVLARHNGAVVEILDPGGRILISTDPDDDDPFLTAPTASRTDRTDRVILGRGGQARAEVSFPLRVGRSRVIVAARRPIGGTQAATRVVRRAFTVAAAAGLAGALLAGMLLAGPLVRRLRRLRDTARRVAEIGPEAELKPDPGRDEIGDLSRTFATMQQRLHEQDQARRAFVATASHELRTPLTSLSIMLDTLVGDLSEQPLDVDRARTQAIDAEAQVVRLSQLATELLNLSRLDAKIPLRSELIELSAVLRSVTAELRVRAEEHDQHLHRDGDDRLWAVGDPSSAAQIIRVVLDNALRHTPAGGHISARAAVDAGTATITVQDDGPGVAAEDRDRIFERFARGAGAKDGGFGLGLAIGRELARQMDGDLTLDASPSGARFTLRLPGAPSPR